MWPALAMITANAALGQRQAKKQRDQIYNQNVAEATKTEMSPWTGMGAGEFKSGGVDDGSAMLGGAMNGVQMAQAFGGFSSKPEDPGFGAIEKGSIQEAEGQKVGMNTNDPFARFNLNRGMKPAPKMIG